MPPWLGVVQQIESRSGIMASDAEAYAIACGRQEKPDVYVARELHRWWEHEGGRALVGDFSQLYPEVATKMRLPKKAETQQQSSGVPRMQAMNDDPPGALPSDHRSLDDLRNEMSNWPTGSGLLDEAPPMSSLDVLALPEDERADRDDDHRYVFRCDGEFWTIVFDGHSKLLKDTKGLLLIKHLLAHPNERFSVHELTVLLDGRGHVRPAAQHMGNLSADELAELNLTVGDLGDAGERLDTEGFGRCRKRYQELEEEIDKAERANDPARAERAREERKTLAEEVSSASGLGGRARVEKSMEKKITGRVTQNIRNSLKQLQTEHANCWKHLKPSINTGAFCSYTPEHQIPWVL